MSHLFYIYFTKKKIKPKNPKECNDEIKEKHMKINKI